MTRSRDRARGALWGVALGDALGMPAQLLSRSQVRERYGTIDRFVAASDDHPIAAGLPAGSITDDTEQTLLLAAMLDADAGVDQSAWATALGQWEDAARARGSHDLLGPSTTAALAALRGGVPVSDAGRAGSTNGAAMRICPVAIAVDGADLPWLVDRVVQASSLTHNTSVALAGAAAVAAAVSAGIGGADVPTALRSAVPAAALAARRGRWVAGADVGGRIDWALRECRRLPVAEVGDLVTDLLGTSLAAQESVPAAFAIAASHAADPWRAMCVAASLGGDADTVASMVGALLGACLGVEGLPLWAIRQVAEVNALDLDPVADHLLEIRSRGGRP